MAKHTRDARHEGLWRKRLAKHAASGPGVRAFCRREMLSEASFYGWRRTIRNRDAEVKSQARRSGQSTRPAFCRWWSRRIVVEMTGSRWNWSAVAAILRRYYGPRSVRFDPRQLLLFGQRVDNAQLDQASIEEEAGKRLVTRRVKNRDKHGRRQLPEHLERIEIKHDLEDKHCPACGNERCRIGAEISEQPEYSPASFKVLRHIRHEYAMYEVRPRWLRPEHRRGKEATAADRQGIARAEPVGVCDHQQAGRPPATVPAGTHLRAAKSSHCPQHDVCVDAVCGANW